VTDVDVAGLIGRECDAIKAMLLAKNAAYGNSALSPVRIFSRAPVDEQIRVRLDDKLSRLARGSNAGEDVEADIIGYLVLLRVQRAMSVQACGSCRVCGAQEIYAHAPSRGTDAASVRACVSCGVIDERSGRLG
jgi:hypothetical protein